MTVLRQKPRTIQRIAEDLQVHRPRASPWHAPAYLGTRRRIAIGVSLGLDLGNKRGIRTKTERDRLVHKPAHRRMRAMVRLARESLAFVSVASFVWMMCAVAAHM